MGGAQKIEEEERKERRERNHLMKKIRERHFVTPGNAKKNFSGKNQVDARRVPLTNIMERRKKKRMRRSQVVVFGLRILTLNKMKNFNNSNSDSSFYNYYYYCNYTIIITIITILQEQMTVSRNRRSRLPLNFFTQTDLRFFFS